MTSMRLGSFIQQNITDILSEWDRFARTRIPSAATMSVLELRDHAEEMLRAIAEYQITGIETTLPFGTFVLKHPAFVSGNFDTNFIRDHFSPAVLAPGMPDEGTRLLRKPYRRQELAKALREVLTEEV